MTPGEEAALVAAAVRVFGALEPTLEAAFVAEVRKIFGHAAPLKMAPDVNEVFEASYQRMMAGAAETPAVSPLGDEGSRKP